MKLFAVVLHSNFVSSQATSEAHRNCVLFVCRLRLALVVNNERRSQERDSSKGSIKTSPLPVLIRSFFFLVNGCSDLL